MNRAAASRNDLDYATGQRPNQEFATLAAAFALQGHTLQRTDPADGPVAYYLQQTGAVRILGSLEDLRHLLAHG
jgi:hypothetical protein